MFLKVGVKPYTSQRLLRTKPLETQSILHETNQVRWQDREKTRSVASIVKPFFLGKTLKSSENLSPSMLSTNVFFKQFESELKRFGYPVNTQYVVDCLKSVEKDLQAWHQKSEIPTIEAPDKFFSSPGNKKNWYKTLSPETKIVQRTDTYHENNTLIASSYQAETQVTEKLRVEREKIHLYDASTGQLTHREMKVNFEATDQAPYKIEILSGIIDHLTQSKQTKVLHLILQDINDDPANRLDIQLTYFNNPKVPYSLQVDYTPMKLYEGEPNWQPTGENVISYEYLRNGALNIHNKTAALIKKRNKSLIGIHEVSQHFDTSGKYQFEIVKDYEIHPQRNAASKIVIKYLKKRIGKDEAPLKPNDLEVFHDTDGLAYLQQQQASNPKP